MWSEKNLLIPLAAAYALGMMKKNGTAIPKVLGMGPAGSAAIIAWAIGKWGHSPLASSAAVGLGSVALYSLGAGEGVAGEGRGVAFDDE